MHLMVAGDEAGEMGRAQTAQAMVKGQGFHSKCGGEPLKVFKQG